jgi:cobyrinic acid a,c-diamide synthase
MGGGFPEMFAKTLAENAGMRASIRAAAESGLPIYAECGGLMYLGQHLQDVEGNDHAMAGVLPVRSAIKEGRLHLGYRVVRARQDTCLLAAGDTVRGHEFHFSSLQTGDGTLAAAYEVVDPPGQREGFVCRNVLASYIHVHMGSKVSLAPRFVATCTRRSA